MSKKIPPQQAAFLHAVHQVGGPSALAKKLGITPAAISRWLRRGKVPPLRVLAVEKETGVSRKALRPDLYPS